LTVMVIAMGSYFRSVIAFAQGFSAWNLGTMTPLVRTIAEHH
jgi:hypothetical protein